MTGQSNRDEYMVSLYNSEYKRLHRVASRMLRVPDLADEIVQETFLLALLRWETLKNHPKPEGWLMTTLINLVKNENRLRAYTDVPIDELFHVPAENDNRGVEDMLPSELSEEERTVIIWRYELGLDYLEIATRLGISESGARSKVSRAVARCRELMKDEK